MKRMFTATILLVGVLLAFWPSTASAAFPGKNGRIAFTALHITERCPGAGDYGSAADEGIFTMNRDGSDAIQASAQHRPLQCDDDIPYHFDNDPSYSPSGKRFVFTVMTYTWISPDFHFAWFGKTAAMGVDGTNRQELRVGWDPAFGPGGKKIVFTDNDWEYDPARVALMSRHGRHERTLNGTGEYASEPSFFPNGGRIVYVSEEASRQHALFGISTIRLDGEHRHRLTKTSRASLNSPDVSPDGKRIAFGRRTGIYVMRSDGTHKHRLADGSDPVFSPNGKRIAFSHDGAIMVMRTDGSHQHAVIPNPLPFSVADPSQLVLADPSWGPKP